MTNKYVRLKSGEAYVWIYSKGKCHRMVVDSCDIDLLKDRVGAITLCHGYARCRDTVMGKDVFVHQLIATEMYGGSLGSIDHMNRDRLDNRRCNIRMVTHSENLRNRGIFENNRLGVRGVHRTPSGRYSATIGIEGKHMYLGTYDTLIEAARARIQAEVLYFNTEEVQRTPIKFEAIL